MTHGILSQRPAVSRRDHVRHLDRRQRAAECAYSVARPLASDREWQRYHHADLPTMSIDQLHAERRRAWRRADDEQPPHPWIAERLAAIEAAIRSYRRLDQGAAAPAPPPKPKAGAGFEFLGGRVRAR